MQFNIECFSDEAVEKYAEEKDQQREAALNPYRQYVEKNGAGVSELDQQLWNDFTKKLARLFSKKMKVVKITSKEDVFKVKHAYKACYNQLITNHRRESALRKLPDHFVTNFVRNYLNAHQDVYFNRKKIAERVDTTEHDRACAESHGDFSSRSSSYTTVYRDGKDPHIEDAWFE